MTLRSTDEDILNLPDDEAERQLELAMKTVSSIVTNAARSVETYTEV